MSMAKASSPADNGKQKVRSAEVGTDILKATTISGTMVIGWDLGDILYFHKGYPLSSTNS